MEAARVTSLLAEQDDAAGDPARQVARSERARHARRGEHARSVVEVSRSDPARDDLQSALRRVDDDHGGLLGVRKRREQLPREGPRVAGRGTDVHGEAQTTLPLCYIDGAVDLVLLPRSEDLTIEHWLRPPQRQARCWKRRAPPRWPGRHSWSSRREAADPAGRRRPAA